MPYVAASDGTRLWVELHGTGEPAFVLVPGYQIVPGRRLYKHMTPFLARHGRVVVYDQRGCGRSDRPGPDPYTVTQLVADLDAVIEAAGVARFALIGLSRGAEVAVRYAVDHPERVAHLVLISPARAGEPPPRGLAARLEQLPYPLYVREFVEVILPEPFSGKHRDDGERWGLELSPAEHDRAVRLAPVEPPMDALLARLSAPTLVVHGGRDQLVPAPRALEVARQIPGARLLAQPDWGHVPVLRHPVATNLAVAAFCGITPPPPLAAAHGRRALFVTSPIGLGHVKRDLAIAEALRREVPGLAIDWLTSQPALGVLERAGERVCPESAQLAEETADIERWCGEHELPIFSALREMDTLHCHNFHTFLDVARRGGYDLWIGDEAWEVEYHLHENPQLKGAARYVFLTDFIGFLPTGDDPSRHEVWQCLEREAQWLAHRAQHPGVCDLSLFLGDEADLLDAPFGPGLPPMREWARRHFRLAGYVPYLRPPPPEAVAALRERLGVAPGVKLVVATVGGTTAGSRLLTKAVRAFELARPQLPAARLLVVGGGRVPEAVLAACARTPGTEVRAFEPELETILAASDLAVVQGGLATTMELALLGRRFLYFPLARHFEQQIHVSRRLDRHGVGVRLDYAATSVAELARRMVAELTSAAPPPPPLQLDADAATRIARAMAALLG